MIRLPRSWTFALAFFAAAMSACATQPDSSDPVVQRARAEWARGDFAAAATDYQQAAMASPAFAEDYLLLASEAALRANDPTRADLILRRIDGSRLDAHQTARAQMLAAQIAWDRGDMQAVLHALPANPDDSSLADAMWLLRARALAKQGDAAAATQALVAREAYLPPEALTANRAIIWNVLTAPSVSPRALTGTGVTADKLTRGWLELAGLARSGAGLAQYDDWRQRYPNHPGEAQLPDLMAGSSAAGATLSRLALASTPALPAALPPPGAAAASGSPEPGNAAALARSAAAPLAGGSTVLLLPASGPLTLAGNEVQAGFTAVAPATVEDTQGTPEGTVAAYRRAQASGAAVIVGPLRKEDATAIAALGAPSVPLLSLNYLDPASPAPAGFWQFGLAPEDEAAAAADDATAQGLRRAIVLVPEGDWGEHLLAAFRARFEANGGQVVDSSRYAAAMQDFAVPIKALLKLDSSTARFNGLVSTLGFKPEFEPQARDDVDMIFIGARVAQARLIAPQFRYWRAAHLPIYATSAANDGNGDFDRAGIRFCDVPALVNGTAAPRGADVVRLDALGRDAAALVQALRDGRLAPGFSLDGATGSLTVDSYGAVHRRLACSKVGVAAAPPPSPSSPSATP